jgi:hypothetical protein
MEQQLIYLSAPCPGRLCAPRKVVREVEALLNSYTQGVRDKARQLAARDPAGAQALWDRAKAWANSVRQQQLAPHRLRVPLHDRFRAFTIPELTRVQLLRQIFDDRRPMDPHISFCLVAPITPCMRLLDKVAVYLHPPTPIRRPYCTGPWWPVPEEHVQTGLVGRHVVVLVG